MADIIYRYAPFLAIAVPVIFAIHAAVSSKRSNGSISHIPGPPSPSWLLGNLLQIQLPDDYGQYENVWRKLYGGVYRFKGAFGRDRLMVSDVAALHHILNGDDFDFSPVYETLFHWLFGARSFVARKGNDHRLLRAAFNPAFTAASVKKYQKTFEQVAEKISDTLDSASELPSVDISPIMSCATLTSVCEAIFGCSVESLGEDFIGTNHQVMALSASQSPGQILADEFASLGLIPHSILRASLSFLPGKLFGLLRANAAYARREGTRLVREKLGGGGQEKSDEMDIYARVLNANCRDEQNASSDARITSEDVISQTQIMIIGGQDTTANALTWTLVELARHPVLQEELRAELLDAQAHNTSYDNLPLLNGTIKETLRLYPTAPFTYRIALRDTVIPLSPHSSLHFTDNDKPITAIPIRKGQLVTLSMAGYQRMESRWGLDSDTYDPRRWVDPARLPQGGAIGPYANLLTFSSGPHHCLGWRFAVLEMQVFIAEMVRRFVFTIPEGARISARYANTLIPVDEKGVKRAVLAVTKA
ncbi:Cytochrome P450 [Mycena kentingensis (nom. inval.)]|nr:Cytochrome P450 [Mycena kentingensis (nom. inval.)]